MNRTSAYLLLTAFILLALPFRSPAPLLFTPGEGWTYESVATKGGWQKSRAKDQLAVAQQAFDDKDYSLSLRAARRVVAIWPLSDYAPAAEYLVGRYWEAKGVGEKAFKEYQKLLVKYPKNTNFEEIMQRELIITTTYYNGKAFRAFGIIPLYRSMDKTASMFAQIVTNGPYSDVAPQAQIMIGETREKQKNYTAAADAYELAADRYHDHVALASDAVYKAGLAYNKQAKTAEYDQGTAGQAISTFTDFLTLYPDDPRVPEAQKMIALLKTEQSHGNFQIAQFYEKSKRLKSALIYYNEVLLEDPNSPYANQARERIATLKKRLQDEKTPG
jgi:outer membrane protein assembly factor BamD